MTTPNTTERMEEAEATFEAIVNVDGAYSADYHGEVIEIIATALSAAEAKGRQEGVREERERCRTIVKAWLDIGGGYVDLTVEAILDDIDEANQ